MWAELNQTLDLYQLVWSYGFSPLIHPYVEIILITFFLDTKSFLPLWHEPACSILHFKYAFGFYWLIFCFGFLHLYLFMDFVYFFFEYSDYTSLIKLIGQFPFYMFWDHQYKIRVICFFKIWQNPPVKPTGFGVCLRKDLCLSFNFLWFLLICLISPFQFWTIWYFHKFTNFFHIFKFSADSCS